jgi:hypothetical protein
VIDARRLASVLALLVASCGAEPQVVAPTGVPWRRTSLDGVARVTAAAHHAGWLLLASGDERRLFAVATSELADGGRASARTVPLELARERLLEGHGRGGGDELAAQGYALGQVWDQPLAWSGLCVRRVAARGAGLEVDRLYLLDRSHGVVFWGRLERDGAGVPVRGMLEHAFVVPGRERAGAVHLDWRDTSPGLVGIAAPRAADDAEDLLLLERGRAGAEHALVRRLDRFGQSRGTLRIGLPPERRVPLAAFAEAEAGRLVLLLDAPEPLLVVVPHAARREAVAAEGGLVPPAPPAGAAWRATAYGEDGTELLVSDGDATVLAWR